MKELLYEIRKPHTYCNTDRDSSIITIWQQNINKSRICQHDLISSARLTKMNIDIIVLQKPVISDSAITITSKDWRVIYLTTHAKHPNKTQSVILICTDIPTNNWSQINIESGDVTVIGLKGD